MLGIHVLKQVVSERDAQAEAAGRLRQAEVVMDGIYKVTFRVLPIGIGLLELRDGIVAGRTPPEQFTTAHIRKPSQT